MPLFFSCIPSPPSYPISVALALLYTTTITLFHRMWSLYSSRRSSSPCCFSLFYVDEHGAHPLSVLLHEALLRSFYSSLERMFRVRACFAFSTFSSSSTFQVADGALGHVAHAHVTCHLLKLVTAFSHKPLTSCSLAARSFSQVAHKSLTSRSQVAHKSLTQASCSRKQTAHAS